MKRFTKNTINTVAESALEKRSTIIVEGGAGSGKTYFVKALLTKKAKEPKIAIVDPDNEYNDMLGQINNISLFNGSVLSKGPEKPSLTGYDLVVIDEAMKYEVSYLKYLQEHNTNIIAIFQEVNQKELMILGDYVSVSIKPNKMIVKEYQLIDGRYKSSVVSNI
ncbi:helicase HerA domain-containing protein [Bacillus salitolerans]|uniref:Helicase HerA domain-containing protein n=1 Tax=Bacillus salitolerans TaxID=1437434 RepID=A0ABW4LM18_9BACI